MKQLSTDEITVKNFLYSCNLHAEQYKDAEMQVSRTPDFRVTSQLDGLFFYCEVKSLETKMGRDGILHSRVVNIFSSSIHDALDQF